MSYYLGVDLGTTYTGAATYRDGQVDIFGLGTHAAVIPSVVFVRDDGAFLVGDAAERRALAEPQGIAREFKRRLGDPTPFIVRGSPYAAEALSAQLLSHVVDTVAAREGGAPSRIALTHPASWGGYKQDVLRQTVSRAGLTDVVFVTEPEAAAIHYASQARVHVGSTIAVYDLGGGTFDVAVLRKTSIGWQILGQPHGIDRLGGIDFDEAIFDHVIRAAGDPLDELDASDRSALVAVASLRQSCVAAKEALSSDTDVTIPVMLPNRQTEVRLTRVELEDMVRPALAESIGSLGRALRSAEVAIDALDAVLLVGGSSRMPLVAELVASELARPVAVDAHPKHAIAFGAARFAAGPASTLAPPPAPPTAALPLVLPPTSVTPAAAMTQPLAKASPRNARPAGSTTKRRRVLIGTALAAVALAGAGAAALAASSSGQGGATTTVLIPATTARASTGNVTTPNIATTRALITTTTTRASTTTTTTRATTTTVTTTTSRTTTTTRATTTTVTTTTRAATTTRPPATGATATTR